MGERGEIVKRFVTPFQGGNCSISREKTAATSENAAFRTDRLAVLTAADRQPQLISARTGTPPRPLLPQSRKRQRSRSLWGSRTTLCASAERRRCEPIDPGPRAAASCQCPASSRVYPGEPINRLLADPAEEARSCMLNRSHQDDR